MKKHADALGYAMNGILWGFRTQPNYRIHIAISILTVAAGLFLSVSYSEWLVLITMIVLGFVIETINTSIEQLGNAIDLNYNEHIKHAKDSSAGAMLLFSIGAVIVAAVIFVPKIIEILI